MVLGRKYSTYKEALVEMNLISLSERRKLLNLQWAKKGIENGSFNDLFPFKIKTHKMDVQTEEKYQIQHFNTEITKKSSVVFMRYLLNEEHRKNI